MKTGRKGRLIIIERGLAALLVSAPLADITVLEPVDVVIKGDLVFKAPAGATR